MDAAGRVLPLFQKPQYKKRNGEFSYLVSIILVISNTRTEITEEEEYVEVWKHTLTIKQIENITLEDEDVYGDKISLEVFFAYSQEIDTPESFILPFFTKVSRVICSEGK